MAALVAALALAATQPYTVAHVKASFHSRTGATLVLEPSATTSSLTTLVTRPRTTTRFGTFELYVIRPVAARSTIRALVGNDRPDARGIYWEPDQNTGVTAITVFRPNLVLNWFPPAGKHRIDARWRQLEAAVAALNR